MGDKYKLIGRLPVPCADVIEWGEWFETADRRVAQTHVGDTGLWVSTVFLALDHNLFGNGPPLLFETIIFSERGAFGSETYQQRCSTWDEAERQHEAAVVVAASWAARAAAVVAKVEQKL